MTPAGFRDEADPGSGPSKQDVIIIATCSSFGALFLGYFLYLAIRKCRASSNSTPHPQPQPLAHHRQLQVAEIEQGASRRETWYNPQFTAHHDGRPYSAGGSNVSLLGGDRQALTPSSQPSIDTAQEISDTSHHHQLPIPTASFLTGPSSRSSMSSDASGPPSAREQPPLASPDPNSPLSQRFPTQRSPGGSVMAHAQRTRPLSMSSTQTYGSGSRTSRYGAPHAPHNQMQIILPTPLASTNVSRDSLPLSGKYGTDGGDRRSIADPWITIGPAHDPSKQLPFWMRKLTVLTLFSPLSSVPSGIDCKVASEWSTSFFDKSKLPGGRRRGAYPSCSSFRYEGSQYKA